MHVRHMRKWLGTAAAAVLLAACASDGLSAPSSPSFTTQPNGQPVTLFKFGPNGTTATFSITATGGDLLRGTSVTIPACDPNLDCQALGIRPVEIWRPNSEETVTITVTEVGWSGNTYIERLSWNSDLDGFANIVNPTDPTATLRADGSHGGWVRFKNIPLPDDNGGGTAGCTPGFWKQSQHFQYWTAPYTPNTQFSAVFANAFPGMTLLQVLQQGGGHLKALGRHTVAALLNGASPDVDYGMTAAQVISQFNAAFASGDYNTLHQTFADANERGCTAKN